MSRSNLLLAAFSLFILSQSPLAASAATPPRSKATIKPAIENIWSTTGRDQVSLALCALYKNRNIVIKRQRKGKGYIDVSTRISELTKIINRGRSYSFKVIGDSKKEKLALDPLKKNGSVCSAGRPVAAPVPTPVTPAPTVAPTIAPTAVPTIAPTATPTAMPAAFSMAAYSGTVNRETARYLLEKAAYGISSNEQAVVNLAVAQNLSGAVDELLRIKEEDSSLANRIEDRKDLTDFNNALGNLTTQRRDNFTFQGFRQAALDLAINTRNPVRENLRHFLLGLWTVGHDVLTNNPAGNPQRALWWDYFKLLGDIAYNSPIPVDIAQAYPGKPKFPSWLVKVGRSPMMLLWLSNNQNVRGNPNENYARELMELFSLGTSRIDSATGLSVENYIEYRNGGNRTLGDIYRAARMLTGWRVSPFLDGTGVMQWRSVYSSEDHDPAVLPMYEGQSFQFSASSDAELVFGIFEKHPAASLFLSKELLRWFVAAEPPEKLVKNFAAVLKANNFDLEISLKTLLKSEAFYHPNYRNTISKNAFQVAVELARTLELSRRDVLTAANAAREVGVNIASVEGTPDNEFTNAYTRGSVAIMGYTTTLPTEGVFFFPESTWTRASSLMETANLVTGYLMSTPELNLLVNSEGIGWKPQRVLPLGAKTAAEVIQFVADQMGVTLSVDDMLQYRQFMEYNYDPARMVNGRAAQFTTFSYDNRLNGIPSELNGFSSANDQETKARWLYMMMAINPQFLLK